jgi:hypothetical protein
VAEVVAQVRGTDEPERGQRPEHAEQAHAGGPSSQLELVDRMQPHDEHPDGEKEAGGE